MNSDHLGRLLDLKRQAESARLFAGTSMSAAPVEILNAWQGWATANNTLHASSSAPWRTGSVIAFPLRGGR